MIYFLIVNLQENEKNCEKVMHLLTEGIYLLGLKRFGIFVSVFGSFFRFGSWLTSKTMPNFVIKTINSSIPCHFIDHRLKQFMYFDSSTVQ